MNFEFIPKGRDATAKAAYLVLRYIYRQNRHQVESQVQQALEDSINNTYIFGHGYMHVEWDWESKSAKLPKPPLPTPHHPKTTHPPTNNPN